MITQFYVPDAFTGTTSLSYILTIDLQINTKEEINT